MHLENFPMDTQACPLRFGSREYQLPYQFPCPQRKKSEKAQTDG